MAKTPSEEIDLSIIITAHSEGILIHHTIASVRRAAAYLADTYSYEIILHVDNATLETLNYINQHSDSSLDGIRVFKNNFGDLGSSRNFAINQAKGRYIATIDADDLMSEEWLRKAVDTLESQTDLTIAHSEVTVEFEGTNSLVIKHGEIDYDTDTLLSVYANRWNSVIVAPRDLLIKNEYAPNSPGYGYEDWNLNCRFIYSKVHNLLVPKTAIFVRRKQNNSEWARQIQSMSVLRANPLLAFDNIHSITDPFHKGPTIPTASYNGRSNISRVKSLLKRHPTTHKIARYIKQSLKNEDIIPKVDGSHVPQWLQDEWGELYSIDRQLFPSQDLMENITVYDTITEDHKLAGSLYKSLVDQLHFNNYSYVIFAPWLTKGGADKYTIEYANTIAELTSSHVLVIATLPTNSPWRDKLSKDVDFLDFGNITIDTDANIRQRLMEHIIENSGTKIIHIINSEFGYDFIRLHENYIKHSGKKVVVTSFSQSVDIKTGRIYGYSHTHVPFVYDIADIITSDNQAVIDMWINEYGFNPKKLHVHRQPVDLSLVKKVKVDFTLQSPLRILWAARIAPEKLPEIAVEIARKLPNLVAIDMYGAKEHSFDTLLSRLPSNVTYKGSYDGFESLKIDNYDILLYTSLFDGMPNVILEAAAAKLPIIASGVGGIPEFIDDHKNGLVITDIHDIDAYVRALKDFVDHNLGASYAAEAHKKLQQLYSKTQYTQSVVRMLKDLGIN